MKAIERDEGRNDEMKNRERRRENERVKLDIAERSAKWENRARRDSITNSHSGEQKRRAERKKSNEHEYESVR